MGFNIDDIRGNDVVCSTGDVRGNAVGFIILVT